MTPKPKHPLWHVAVWMAERFEDRTRALAEDRVADLQPDMIEPGSRVVYSEVRARFPEACGVDARVALQPLFERALRARGLLGVLRGRITTDRWYARHPATVKP